jgi:hypothetical protein
MVFTHPNRRRWFHRCCKPAWNYTGNVLLYHFNVLIKICTRDLKTRIFLGINIRRCNLIIVLVQKLIDLAVGEDFCIAIFSFIEQLSLFHKFELCCIIQDQLNHFMSLLFC